MDRDALRPVHLLHLVHEVQLDRPAAEDAQHLVRVDRARDELLADGHVAAVADQKPGAHRDLVRRLFRAVVGHHDDLPGLLGLLDLDPALVLADGRHALRDTGLEELLDTRQAVGDVLARHTTGVEGPHGELGAGLADRLGGDDADGLADVHPLAGGERAAVALAADADLGLADQHAVRADGLHPGLGQPVDHRLGRVFPGLGQHHAVDLDVLRHGTARAGVLDVRQLAQAALGVLLRDPHAERTVGAAVLLAHDHVLRHVHQAAGEVPGVRRAERGVGQALAGTVGRDEVLDHRQPLAEAGPDRPRDGLALRVGDQAAHAGDLPDLHRVTAGAGVDHHPDRVGLGEGLLHVLRHLGGGVRPDLDELLTALLVGDQAAVVLALHLVGAALVVLQDLRLVRRRDDILDADRDTRPGGPVEAGVLERVKGRRHLDLRVGLGERVDDDRQRLPVHQVVDEREVGRQRLVEDAPAQRGGQPDRTP